MAEGTHVREQNLPEAKPHLVDPPQGRRSSGFWRALGRVFFWAYERGTWQYDLIVIAILVFIFLSPRSWFDDRPTLQLTDLRRHQGIVEVSHSKERASYLIDSRLVDSTTPQKLEETVRELVRSRAGQPFTIKSIRPERDRNNVLLGYTVEIQFQ